MTLLDALATARRAVEAANAAPQSRKKAMLAALVLDAAIDALFETSGEGDLLAFRAGLTRRQPALQPVLAYRGLPAVTVAGDALHRFGKSHGLCLCRGRAFDDASAPR